MSTISRLRSRSARLLLATATATLISIVDRRVHGQMSFGLLYLVPVILASTALKRWQVPLLGGICTAVAEWSDAFSWSVQQGIPRDAMYFLAYTSAGLYVSEVLSKRRTEQAHLRILEAEVEARRSTEEQLQLLVASSSIAIVTSDEQGIILQANSAAERVFATEDGPAAPLEGLPLATYLPSLARVPLRKQGQRPFKTMMQCQGLRAGTEPFLADTWFSTYLTRSGGRMTSMIVDSSLEMRDREEENLEQLLTGSRLLVGAVSHEIRNISGAIALVQQNLLAEIPELESREDFVALQQLVLALERMASVELSQVKRQGSHTDLGAFFRNLRIIVTPSLREAAIRVDWHLEQDLPDVWADQQSLLQVFLNLFRNAEAALSGLAGPQICINARQTASGVEVRVSDNGGGVRSPELLFRPFEATSGQTGLGLYLSRAMMSSFRGELRYEASSTGAVFVVEMMAADL